MIKSKRFFFVVSFHLDLIEDQVWIQANNTDWDLSEALLERGILEQDIIIGSGYLGMQKFTEV